jgi:hypothetical protein
MVRVSADTRGSSSASDARTGGGGAASPSSSMRVTIAKQRGALSSCNAITNASLQQRRRNTHTPQCEHKQRSRLRSR